MALINSFLSYFLLMLLFVAAAGAAVALGIHLRRKKNDESDSSKLTGQE